MARQSRKLTREEKSPKYIDEPLPGPTHVICAICQFQFVGYYEHIQSERHKKGVGATTRLYNMIDEVIDEIDVERGHQRLT